MRRFVLGLVLYGCASFFHQASAATLSEILPEMALGSKDAPVTMVEHSSLTCGHCGAFHRETLPEIKKTYIDTGKVRLVYRDFPLGRLALVASMLPHCAGPERYFGFLEVLFRGQNVWSRSDNPLEALRKVGRMGGMTNDQFDACLNNQDLFKAIRERAQDDQVLHGIDSTPTFRIDGKTLNGALPFEEFKKVIDAALEKQQ